MTRNQKTGTAIGSILLILLLLTGTGMGGEPVPGKIKIPPKPDEPCDGHWSWDAEAFAWVCVPGPPSDEPCPAGYVRDEKGDCVPAVVGPPPDEPPPVQPGVIDLPGGGDSDDPNDYIKPYPTGGNFYQVVAGDQAYGGASNPGIVYKYLRTEGYLAAKEYGDASDAEANDFGKLVAGNAQNRIKAWTEVIGCSGVNDLAYATWGYDPDNDPDPAFTGRAIRLVPQHPNNLQRLLNGQGLARCIKLGTQATKGNASGVRVDGECTSFELLWLPMINRQALWESGGTVLKTEDGETWADGTSKGLPPPFVTDRQFYRFPGSLPEPTPKIWGCFALQLELE